MTRKIYVDMDNVLVNFHKVTAPVFNLPYPSKTVLGYEWLLQAAKLTPEEVLSVMKSHPRIWEEAEPFPWTADLIQLLDVKTPHWLLLTTATHDPACWSGKVKWVERYLSSAALNKLVIVGGPKSQLAGRGDVLVDDAYHNVAAWREAGGAAYHWVEYSEDMTELAAKQVIDLSTFLDAHFGYDSNLELGRPTRPH